MTLKNFVDGDFERGNQTDEFLDLSAESLYNPGYSNGGAASDRDIIISIDATSDIAQSSKVTLGDYLSKATRGQVYRSRANSFTVPDGSNNTTGDAYLVSENASTHTSPSQAAEQMRSAGTTLGTFLDLTKGLNSDASQNFTSTKNSDYGRGENPFVETDIKKVGSVERAKGSDGHTLLPGIRGRSPGPYGVVDLGDPQNIRPVPESAPLVQQKISEVLRQNRFNSIERAFVENHQRQVPGGYTIQRSMGEYDPNAPEVDENKLLNVGQLLMIRSTGHDVTGDLLSPTASGDLTALINLAPIVPSFSQITGLPLIDVGNLEARNISITNSDTTSNPARTDYINKEFKDLDVFAGLTYGSLNSDIEPFEDPYPIGMLTTTIAGVVSLTVLSAVIAFIPALAVGESSRTTWSKPVYPSQLRMGSYSSKEDESFILELLQIPRTDHPWGKCFIVGFGSFLGIDINENLDIDTEKLKEALLDFIVAPPGYYVGIVRNAVRSIEKITNAVTDVASSFSGSTGTRDITGGVARIFSLIKTVTNSAAWKFVMAMVTVGNQLLNSSNRVYKSINSLRVSRDNPVESLHQRSRLLNSDADGKATLGWSLSHRTHLKMSSYVLPRTFSNAHAKMRSADDASSLMKAVPPFLGAMSRRDSDRNAGAWDETRPTKERFDAQTVIDMERRLDSEYVPFYFHDLRTNEIISFSAFLNDLSDGFAANYTSTQGYGRADEVMVYNSTKRSMSLSFFVGATNKEDLSKMYWDINKLVSMVYPQYSRGRAMQSGQLKFVQPFSQLPTASPMIRLRVGDIVKGNYSRFGLARLFGLGNNDVFNGDTDINNAEQRDRDATRLNEATRQVQQEETSAKSTSGSGFSQSQKVVISTGEYKLVSLSGEEYQPPADEFDPEDDSLPEGSLYAYRAPAEVQIVREWIDTPSPPAQGRRTRRRRPPVTLAQTTLSEKKYVVKILDTSPHVPNVSNDFKYHIVSHSSIEGFTASYRQELINNKISSSAQQTNTQSSSTSSRSLSEFMSPEKNPLVKSFETTIGKGLAGFITDLKFDWNDSTWATEDQGSKAPIFMRVSLSFSPIHDIPMGLDSSGMMRSVAYNVGNASGMIGSEPYPSLANNTQNNSSRTNTGG